jgi:hypothetical protein
MNAATLGVPSVVAPAAMIVTTTALVRIMAGAALEHTKGHAGR